MIYATQQNRKVLSEKGMQQDVFLCLLEFSILGKKHELADQFFIFMKAMDKKPELKEKDLFLKEIIY